MLGRFKVNFINLFQKYIFFKSTYFRGYTHFRSFCQIRKIKYPPNILEDSIREN